jgi:hypothetical protein
MHRLLFVPFCLMRGACLPALAVGAILASIVYVASRSTEKQSSPPS